MRALEIVMVVVLVMVLVMVLGEELVSLPLCCGAGRPADVRPALTALRVPFARTERHGGALCLGHPGLLAHDLAALEIVLIVGKVRVCVSRVGVVHHWRFALAKSGGRA